MNKTVLATLAFSAMTMPGCMKQVERTIPADMVGTKYARLTGYFGTSGSAPGGRHEESSPGHIRHERIRDEATLMHIGPRDTCVAVIVRTASQHDEPLDQLEPKCKTDGGNADAIVENERIRVVDYGYTGMAPVVQADGVAASAYVGMAVSKPAEKVFRVIERQASVCCPVVAQRKVELHLWNERWTEYTSPLGIEFVWKLK